MREILFRGKTKGLIDWKYGSYAKCIDDHIHDNPELLEGKE